MLNDQKPLQLEILIPHKIISGNFTHLSDSH